MKPQKILPCFRQSGVKGVVALHQSNLRFLSYRFKTAFWQCLAGIRFFWFLKAFDEEHDLTFPDLTVAEGAWNFLDTIGFKLYVDWRFDQKALKGLPVLFYADHPGYIEPFLILAALKEFNPKVVATAWIRNLSPLIAERIIAVPDSLEVVRKSLSQYRGVRRILETVWAYLIVIPVTSHLQGDVSPEENRLLRIGAFRAILQTFLQNEALLLFPQGGEGQKPWVGDYTEGFRRLLEILLRNRRDNPVLNELRLVPVVIRRYSIRALFKSRLVMGFHPLYFPFRLLPGRPFEISIREQFVLSELAKSFTDTEQMVCHLMQRLKIK